MQKDASDGAPVLLVSLRGAAKPKRCLAESVLHEQGGDVTARATELRLREALERRRQELTDAHEAGVARLRERLAAIRQQLRVEALQLLANLEQRSAAWECDVVGCFRLPSALAASTALDESERVRAVAQLRSAIRGAQDAIDGAQQALTQLQHEAPSSSRASFLRALPELLGAPPTDRTWQNEWVDLTVEFFRLSGQTSAGFASADYVRKEATVVCGFGARTSRWAAL